MYGIAMSYAIPGTYGSRNLLDPSLVDFGNNNLIYQNPLFASTLARIQGIDEIDTLGRRRTFIKGLYQLVTLDSIVYLKYPTGHARNQDSSTTTDSANIVHFPSLMGFVDRLPFVSYGRVLLFLTEHGQSLHVHSDINENEREDDLRMDFIWISSSMDKNFFIYDPITDTRHPVESRSAFFNVKDFHGTLPASSYSYSLRVDGWFTEAFREKIGLTGMESY